MLFLGPNTSNGGICMELLLVSHIHPILSAHDCSQVYGNELEHQKAAADLVLEPPSWLSTNVTYTCLHEPLMAYLALFNLHDSW
jgi:hypothetical protein